MVAEKRKRLDLDGRGDALGLRGLGDAVLDRHVDAEPANSARLRQPFDGQREQQGPRLTVDSDVLHRHDVSPRLRLPSVASFLPRPSISSGPPPYSSDTHHLPSSPPGSRLTVANIVGPPRTPWDPRSQEQLSALEENSAASLTGVSLMRTRRRFSPRRRLRASKRLGGQSLPPWSRPVGVSLASTVRAHELLPHDSDRFLLRPRESEQYPRYQRSEWGEHASSGHYRPLTSTETCTSAGMGPAARDGKSSRYLREIDRRAILARIECGEKQSALAKEFHVTRAAICNLNKHRELIMTRSCDDPLAKHPKRAKPIAGGDSDEERERDENADSNAKNRVYHSDTDERKGPAYHQTSDQVYLVDSRAVAMLSVLMGDRSSTELEFRHHSARLMVCLIEEAVAWMYSRRQLQHQPQHFGRYDNDREPMHFMLEEYYTRRPPCGVTLDELGPLFLDKFRSIDPTWRCGVIEFADSSTATSSELPVRIDLPRALPACNVFLLLSFARDGGCQRLHQCVRILIDHGVVEELLCLVALGISSRAVHLLHAEFPRLRVATASLEREAVDSRGDISTGHQLDVYGGTVGSRTTSDGHDERAPIERLAKLAVSSSE